MELKKLGAIITLIATSIVTAGCSGISFQPQMTSQDVGTADLVIASDKNNKDIAWRNHDFEQIVAESVNSKKIIMLFFYASWCDYCAQMLTTTLKNEQVVSLINESFVPVKLDIEGSEIAREIARKNEIETVPTTDFVKFTEDDLELLLRVTGFRSVEEMQKAFHVIKNLQ